METPFRRLLLATEHSEFDAGAERVALAMAAHCGLPLMTVLPLVSNPEFEALAPQLAARAEAEALAKGAELDAAARAAGATVDFHVRRGEEPWQEIVAEAREREADLVITRRRGKRGFLASLLVGDMVTKVAAQAPCSVLMVGRPGQMWSRGVLAALDGSALAPRVAQLASAVAAQCALPLTLLRVVPGEAQRSAAYAALAELGREAERAGIRVDVVVAEGKVHEAVMAGLADSGADLLVVGLTGEDAVERANLGGNARKLIGLAQVPVLIAKQ